MVIETYSDSGGPFTQKSPKIVLRIDFFFFCRTVLFNLFWNWQKKIQIMYTRNKQ